MSMISDLVKKLRWIADYDQYQNRNSEVTIRKAADTIEMLSQKARATEQEWIPCSERLPKIGEKVLVSTKKTVFTQVYKGIYSDPKRWAWENNSVKRIEAWQPLPKPWKGADDE